VVNATDCKSVGHNKPSEVQILLSPPFKGVKT